MIRLLLVLAAAAALLVAAWSTGRSTAAFVAAAETPAAVQADDIGQWLAAPAVPEEGPCSTADRGVECSVVVEARSPLPGGAQTIDVRLTTAAAEAGRTDARSADATLAAGERRTLTITLPEREDLRVSARTPGDSTDFLSRLVPACGEPCGTGTGGGGGDADPATPATPADPTEPRAPAEPPVRGDTPVRTPGGATRVDSTQDATGAAPSQTAPAPTTAEPSRTCVSRRRFTVRLPKARRGKRVLAARVTVGKRRVATRRSRRDGRFTFVVDLRGLPRSAVRVVAVLRVAGGRNIRLVRTYRTCYRREATPAGS